MASEIIKTQLHPQKPADETDIIYPETSADQVKGLPTTNETAKQTVVANKDGYSLMPYNAPTQVRVGETQTLPEGYQASVQNVGTPEAPVLNFQIPQGKTGPQGPRGLRGETGTTNIFYILNQPIYNGIGDKVPNILSTNFIPIPTNVTNDMVIYGISQPSGALVKGIPNLNDGVFNGTFTVTTLGFAGVANGGNVRGVLDIFDNVHIGRNSPNAKLYVRDIRFDKMGDEDGPILFSSRVDFDKSTFFHSKTTIDNLDIEQGDAKGQFLCNQLSVGKISKSSKYRPEQGIEVDSELHMSRHRIVDGKLNTNQININIEQLNSDEAFHFVNLFTGEETVLNSAGNHTVTFPCAVYLTAQNSNYGVNVTVKNTGYTLFAISKIGFRVTTNFVEIGECTNTPSDPYYNYEKKFVVIFLSNYNRPIDGQLIKFDIARS